MLLQTSVTNFFLPPNNPVVWSFMTEPRSFIIIMTKLLDFMYKIFVGNIAQAIQKWRKCSLPFTILNEKELGCFHIILAQILTAHNFCLTRITASILIYANALGYFLSIKVEFVIRNMISICLCCSIWEGGSKKCNFQKIEEDK